MAKVDLSRLNPRQKEAVLFGNGPLLILAGAGSGKTSTMTYRIAHLMEERHVRATQILGLSFTRKAANELKERVHGLVTKPQGLTLSTFHSLCVQILRAYAPLIGYPKDFSILDRTDQVDTIKDILKNIKVDDRKFDPETILFEIGQAKNRFIGPSSFSVAANSAYPDLVGTVYEHYQARLKAQASMDFDDLLFLAVGLLDANHEARDRLNDRFRYLLVDEYQDTNPAQSKLLGLLTERSQNICVVGDDDQSIYAWRGADPTHILQFAKHYPGAHTITLDQNYRSTEMILNAANEVISKNKVRHPKKLWSDKGLGEPLTEIVVEDDRAEADHVADEISVLAKKWIDGKWVQTRSWRDFAVLYRSNPQSRLFEEALRMRQIPYKIVGTLSFLERKEVKDVLCYWKLIVNPVDDAAARRIVNWPSRGIGKTSLENWITQGIAEGKPFISKIEDSVKAAESGAPSELTKKTLEGATSLVRLLETLRGELAALAPDAVLLSNWGRRSLELIGVKEAIFEDNEDPVVAERKWDNALELVNALGQMSLSDFDPEERASMTAPTFLREFLTRMSLGDKDDDERERKDKDGNEIQRDEVTLLTLHGSKGLEFPVVFLVGIEEGLLPHRRTIEEAKDFSEERRLAYVGITRAKERLYLTRAKNRIRYGKKVPRNPSRFLEEIPKDLIVSRNESQTPDLSTKELEAAHEEKVKSFLSQIRSQISRG